MVRGEIGLLHRIRSGVAEVERRNPRVKESPMSEETQPTAVATPAPAKPVQSDTVVDQLRKALKPSKKERAAELKTKAETKGANSVLRELGVKKSERARVLEELKAGKLRLADAAQESAEAKATAAQATSDAEASKAEIAILKAQSAEKDALLKGWADEQFNALPEELQKFIAATAGESLDARLKAIKTAKESGLITVKEAAAATAQAKGEAKPVKPSTTSVAVNPKALRPEASPGPKQIWQQMRESARAEPEQLKRIALERMAAGFYAANQMSIDSDL
jgi:hypothetical protein